MITRYSTARPSEHDEQVRLATYLDFRGALWCHVPNETGASHGFGLRTEMRAEGVKPGVPDVLIFGPLVLPGDRWLPVVIPGIAIDVKKRGRENDVSEALQRWLDDLDARGWHTFVGTADESIEFLKTRGI